MLEPYDGKLSRTVLRREGGGNTADPADYAPLVERLHGQVIHISPASTQYINPMDINSNYSEEDNPLALKADFVLSLCELVVGGKEGLQPVEVFRESHPGKYALAGRSVQRTADAG